MGFGGLRAFVPSSTLPSAELAELLAGFGTGSALVMWWVVDSMERRHPLPVMSLWIGFWAGWLVLPIHYFSTRGRAGTRRFFLMVTLMLLVWGGAGVLGVRVH